MAYKQLKLWFDSDLAELLAEKLISNGNSFNKNSFVNMIVDKVDDLELKDRVEHFSDSLRAHLSDEFTTNISCLMAILGPENEKETGMFKEFYWVMPIAKYVEKYGLEHFEVSMDAIKEITMRNTGEYTIRPFLEKFPKRTIDTLLGWSHHPNKHVRRLSSEGVRPRLPWASKLDMFIEDPRPLFPILDNLKDDTSKYVQKSVANCLNDIIKDNPEMAKAWIELWAPKAGKERKWIIKHALRNLIKVEDKWALSLIAKFSNS
ncbi:DNA alkylation repair protein [Flagellimonas flava]|uniref:DNA-3-methylpurine glycosylase n=1 Tax=Flagellimonas flava TaxID=570519 RepID=A0A1M5IHS0_9FLAO|nr:DNA alkylation repair protein [Allomuricauda flava]SHG27796.1 DNA-3-methylpurine glycosylase [Allomuricauda flava]